MRRLILFCLYLLFIFFNSSIYAEDFNFTSNAFADNGVLPVHYTCDGEGISPQLSWSALPTQAKSLVILLTSLGKDKIENFHWILYDLPITLKELPENFKTLPKGAKMLANSWGKKTYFTPCTELNTLTPFVFKFYALDKKLNLPDQASVDDLQQAMKNHILLSAKLTAVYIRWPVKIN